MENERRVKSRYRLELNARYHTMAAVGPVAGVGQTVNMSSSGLLLSGVGNIPEGTRMKVFVEWPSLLNGTTPLQLITVGRVVRSTDAGVSITFESYQFRTMSRTKQSQVTQMPEGLVPPFGDPRSEPLTYMAKSPS